MGQTVRYQEALRRLAMIDEGFVEDEAGLGLDLARTSTLEPKAAALLQLAVSVAIGSPAVCLEWSATRALAAGATKDEIADVLLAIASVTGLGRVVCAAPDVATALGYDVQPHWRNQTIRNSRQSATSNRQTRKSKKIRERMEKGNAGCPRHVLLGDPGMPYCRLPYTPTVSRFICQPLTTLTGPCTRLRRMVNASPATASSGRRVESVVMPTGQIDLGPHRRWLLAP